ncbi:MAG TPA: S8 family serine peptidase, partial [Candidatus Kapabacteria bacterium]|nr:S8 family serine peptidase [Candidatus Kapabacteria bacterium]
MLQKKYLKLGKFCAFLVAFFVSGQTVLFAKTITDPAGEQWAYRDTKVYEAWDVATGSRNVVVAVIDNGFDMYHPDLYGNVWKNDDEVPDNGVDDDKNGYTDDVWGWNFVPEDVNGDGSIDIAEQMGNNDPRPSVFASTPEAIHHGTVVAGIIGGLGNNQQDGAGINWRVRLMNLKVANNVGEGSMVGLDRAVRYAVDNGAHVINLSIVGDVQTALRDVFRYAHEKGVVVVAAAGNDSRFLNRSPQYPVCVDEGESEEWVLGVSAIDESHRITHFSNVGSSCIDITAPGVNIASTLRYSPQYGLQNTYGTGWNGTSFAAPFVTGAAALLKSMHPEWTAKEISTTLLTTVHKTPPLDEAEYAHLYGAGLLQINKAV